MNAVDLYGEVRAALYHPDQYTLLAPLGLEPDVAFSIGATNVRPDTNGLYIPDDDDAVIAAIVPVMPPGGELIDLVAVDITQPDRWRRRTGLGDMLGEINVFGLFGKPLFVHKGPAEWLRAYCEGICVLEFTTSARNLLNAIPGGIEVADDLDFAETLERELTQPARQPTIYLRQQQAE